MRVSKEQAEQNRARILTSAARLFRERGIGATGVDSITQDAGLTHGGLYSQFGSKEAIAAEAIRFALDAPGNGCVVAALGTDIARQPRRVRHAFTSEMKDDLEFLSRLMPGDDRSRRYEDAILAFSSMIGALILARAVSDETFSDLILKTTAKRLGKVAKAGRRARR